MAVAVKDGLLKGYPDGSFLPLAGLGTALGGQVGWDAEAGHANITLSQGSRFITLQVTPGVDSMLLINAPGKGLAAQFISQQQITLGSAPPVIGGHIYLPLGVLAKAMGWQVTWDATTRTATIDT